MNTIAIKFIRFVSAFFRSFAGGSCRFHPTCSVYAGEAFSRFSFTKAARLTLQRLGRCHPFSAGGHDPL